MNIVKLTNDDGTEVLFEIDDNGQGMAPVSRGGKVIEVTQAAFEKAIAGIRPLAGRLVSTMKELNQPEELTLAFGIKVDGKADVLVASASAEANISVTIKWKNSK